MCVLSAQVFLKEPERQQLQDTLHKDVMRKIIFLQRWFKARLQRKEYLDMRQAAILIQVRTAPVQPRALGRSQFISATLISPAPTAFMAQVLPGRAEATGCDSYSGCLEGTQTENRRPAQETGGHQDPSPGEGTLCAQKVT